MSLPLPPVKRIFIVDDHPMMREGLKYLLAEQVDLECCGEAAKVAGTTNLIESTHPDLVMIDISLKDGSGIELIQEIRRQNQTVRILILSMYDVKIYGHRVFRAGAQGYLNKQEPAETLLQAIRLVLSGGTYWPAEIAGQFVTTKRQPPGNNPGGVASLSDRELEVFQLIGQGLTTGQVARSLFLSPHTIDTHREKIKLKLGIKTAGELQREAVQWMLENS